METISARELDQYVQDDRYKIIDLRTREAYQTGHIRGAMNVPYGVFRTELSGLKKKILVLYCEWGGLSMTVSRDLEQLGFRTKSVVGGIRAYRGKNFVVDTKRTDQ